MNFANVAISKTAPNAKNVLWCKPVDGGFMLYINGSGGWKPLKVAEDGGTPGVSDDKPKAILTVTNIQNLTTKQCNALNVGDQVIKKTGNQRHLYTVTYKEDKQGMCLSYIDAENAETIAYDWNNSTNKWEFTDKTVTPLVSSNP